MDQWIIWLGGLCGIVSPILTLIMVIASTIISPWFSWNTNALSQLGVGEVSLLFNSAVIVGGILNLLFTLGIREYFPKEKLAKTGVTLILLGNLCLVLVGIFTVSYPTYHAIVALGEFMLGPIGIILIGFSSKEITIKKISIATGIAALISIVILPVTLLALQIKIGFAVPEIIEALIVSAWIIFMGTKMLKFSARAH